MLIEILQKLESWFHNQARKVSEQGLKLETDRLFQTVAKETTDTVRRVADFQFYQTLYYDSKIRPVYEKRLEEAQQQAGVEALSRSETMKIRQRVVKELWDAESEEQKKHVHDLAEADYKRREAEHNDGLRLPSTPEEFDE